MSQNGYVHDAAHAAAESGRSPWLTPALVLLATAAAFGLRLFLSPWLRDDSPFSVFILAVMLASLVDGWRSGVVTTVLSASLAWICFVMPYLAAAPSQAGYLVQLGVFIIIALTVAAVNERWHRLRRRLSAQEAFISTVLENAPTGVLAIDAEGCITFANSAAAGYFGLSSGLLVGRPYEEAGLHSSPHSAGQPGLPEVLREGLEPRDLRLVIEDASASRVELRAQVTRLRPAAPTTEGGWVLSLLPA